MPKKLTDSKILREAVLNSLLPPVLFVRDIARVLGLSRSGARKAVLRGDCGAYTRVGKRLAVSRQSFEAALRRCPASGAVTEPKPPDEQRRPSLRRINGARRRNT